MDGTPGEAPIPVHAPGHWTIAVAYPKGVEGRRQPPGGRIVYVDSWNRNRYEVRRGTKPARGNVVAPRELLRTFIRHRQHNTLGEGEPEWAWEPRETRAQTECDCAPRAVAEAVLRTLHTEVCDALYYDADEFWKTDPPERLAELARPGLRQHALEVVKAYILGAYINQRQSGWKPQD